VDVVLADFSNRATVTKVIAARSPTTLNLERFRSKIVHQVVLGRVFRSPVGLNQERRTRSLVSMDCSASDRIATSSILMAGNFPKVPTYLSLKVRKVLEEVFLTPVVLGAALDQIKDSNSSLICNRMLPWVVVQGFNRRT